jgi:hypothetical protein
LLASSASGELLHHFLVAEIEPSHYDSYVLPLQDPAAVAHARELIRVGPSAGEPIVVARIAPGADGINRDFLAPGSPPWSWHVTNFEGFADNTIEILDGWPSYVESDVEGWMANTGGYIGFWSYTVVAELPPGDYDDDLDIDEDDYSVWQAAYGRSILLGPQFWRADGNSDGIVDAADYVLWRKNLGSSFTIPPHLIPPAAVAFSSVPEPTTMRLVIAVTVLVAIHRYQRLASGRRRQVGGLDSHA